jgi:hypothetical protein
LLGGKERVPGLGHGGSEDILAADVDALAGGAAEFLVEPCRILVRKLLHATDPEQLKIAEHGWPYGD